MFEALAVDMSSLSRPQKLLMATLVLASFMALVFIAIVQAELITVPAWFSWTWLGDFGIGCYGSWPSSMCGSGQVA